jgi:hypothetical protein
MAEKEPNTPSSSSQRESTFFFFLCKQSIFSLQSNLKLNYFTENPFRFTANLKPYQSHFSSLTTIVSNFDNVPDHAKTILTRYLSFSLIFVFDHLGFLFYPSSFNWDNESLNFALKQQSCLLHVPRNCDSNPNKMSSFLIIVSSSHQTVSASNQ